MPMKQCLAMLWRSAMYVVCSLGIAACPSHWTAPESTGPEVPVPHSTLQYLSDRNSTLSPQQQTRDQSECNTWAVEQTAFDPQWPEIPPHLRLSVIAGVSPTAKAAHSGADEGAASRPWYDPEDFTLGENKLDNSKYATERRAQPNA